MRGLSVFLIVGICAGWGVGAFLNNKPFPTYSLEDMPDTEFSCREKILGGYYADPETKCQMFHICVKVAGVGVQDFRFLCPNGTAFDQDHQICADWEDVDCDATTLYYSSDNFDLYRLGSGYESKARKYGEDEETFALQRAETGDARINREQTSHRINQQKDINVQYNKPKARPQQNNQDNNQEVQYNKPKSRPQQHQQQNNQDNNQEVPYRQKNRPQVQQQNNNQQDNNQERDIFKGSSSSNFFNNKNNGKENDEDYDDGNVNVNQDRDDIQKKKVIRKQSRRPALQNNENNNNQNKNDEPKTYNEPPRKQPVQQNRNNYNRQEENYDRPKQINRNNNNNNNNKEEETDKITTVPARPTGFRNNFAGSSYIPTTSKPSSTTINAEQYTTAVNNHRQRVRQRVTPDRQYNNAENFRQTQSNNSPTPTYTVSTPAPFKQTQQYNNAPQRTTQFNNNNNNGQYNPTTSRRPVENYPTTTPPQRTNKQTDNYPSTASVNSNRNTETYNQHYDIPKVKQQPENLQKNKQTTPYRPHTDNYPNNNPQYSSTFDKKQTTPLKQQQQTDNLPTTFAPRLQKQNSAQFNQKSTDNFPTTFAPRTNAGYTQISQQTTQYKSSQQQQNTQQYSSPNTHQQSNSTPRTTPFTQYTPTVPKISSTTPVSRSNRFDETSYDDGSYSTKYDYDNEKKEDEFLKTAHSQNIANSRNEFSKTTKALQNTQTQKPNYESPRPFSVSPNTPKVTDYPKSTTRVNNNNNNYNNNNSNNNSAQKNQAPLENNNKNNNAPRPAPKKKDYDYAYYDTSVGSDPEYEIDTDIKKSTVSN